MRNKGTLLLCGLVLLAAVSFGQSRSGEWLALTGGKVYPSPDAAPIENGVVLVQNGRIVQVGTMASTRIPAGATIFNCSGQFVTAGFQNSHVHFTEAKWEEASSQSSLRLSEQLSTMFLRYGFTTVVDTASDLNNTVALRRRIDSGEVAGPRILTAGFAAYPPNGVPYYVKDSVPGNIVSVLPQPVSAQQAVEFVRRNVNGGADIVKLFTGSWITKDDIVVMPVEVAAAAVSEAHRNGKLVFSHPSNVAGLEVALRAHIDVLAHAIEDTRSLSAEHLRRMRAQKMAMIPTLHLFARDSNFDEILKEVGDYQRSGGEVLFGTDAGFLPDSDPTDEFLQMNRAGLTWRQILASLTINPARRFGEGSRRGRLTKGQQADLVVLGDDPAADVHAFTNITAVFHAGRMIFQGQQSQR